MRHLLVCAATLFALCPPAAAQDVVAQVVSAFEALNAPHPEAFDTGHAVNGDRLMRDVEALSALPRWTVEGRVAAIGYLQEQLQAAGWSTQTQPFDVGGEPGGANVVAFRQGSDPSLAPVVLGAHFDAWDGSPGADDNASGVAATLEVARVWREQGLDHRRSVYLALFDLEETFGNYFGSKHFLASLGGQPVAAAIVLEGVGRTCSAPGCQRFPGGLPTPPPPTGDFLAVVVDLENAALVDAFRRTAQPDLPLYALAVPFKGSAAASVRRSDHQVFWDANIGAIMLADTGELRGDTYHTAGDSPAVIDRAFLMKSTRAALDGLWMLANTDGP